MTDSELLECLRLVVSPQDSLAVAVTYGERISISRITSVLTEHGALVYSTVGPMTFEPQCSYERSDARPISRQDYVGPTTEGRGDFKPHGGLGRGARTFNPEKLTGRRAVSPAAIRARACSMDAPVSVSYTHLTLPTTPYV